MYKVTLYPRASYPQGGMTLLDTSSGVNPGILTAVVSLRLNEAGNFTYGIIPSSPLYEYTDPLKYYVSVEEDNTEIFYGRILSVQKNPLTLVKQVTCEGALAFLLDAELALDKDGHDYSASAYFAKCINEYNSAIGNDPARALAVGTVSVSGSGETINYKSNSFTQIQSAIKNQLVDKLDGFLNVRRTSNGAHVLDWVEQVGVTNPQPIQITHNVIGQTTTDSGEDIFTLMHPVGKDNLDIGLLTISSTMLSQYGQIVRSVTFDAENADTLRSKANAYIEKLRDRLSLSGSISFVDVHYLDGTVPSVKIGDVFTNIRGYEGTKLNADTLNKDLLAPQNDKFTLKNDKDLLRSAVANGANSSATSAAAGGKGSLSGGSSFRYKFIHETDKDLALAARNIEISAEEKIAMNAKQIEMNAENIQQNTADIVAQGETWTTFEGTSFYQNKDHITQVAGKYTIDSETGNVLLEEGADLVITKNGVHSLVGKKTEEHDQTIDDLNNWVTEYEGTAIYQGKDHIAQVAGKYTFEDYIDPHTGEHIEKLILKEGTKLYQSANGGSFGYYSDNDLTAGVLFQKLSDGRTSSGIVGDKVFIGSGNDKLDSWVTETDSGLVAVKASIKTLQADLVDANKIQARISSLDTLVAKSIIISGGGTLSTTGYVAAGEIKTSTLTLGGNSVTSLLKDASVSGNVLTITKHDGSRVTFSKATTLEGGWSGGTYTVTASPQGETISTKLQSLVGNGDVSVSSSGKIISQDFYVTYGEDGDTSYAQTGANLHAAINATPVYNNGWAAAWSELSIPYAPNYTDSMTVAYPGVTADTSGDPAVYTVSADDDYAYIKRGSTTVARTSHSAYSNGWVAARNELSIPYAPNYTDSMTVAYPGVTVDTSGDPAVYTVSADNDYAYIKRGGTTVARTSHSAYSNGFNSGHANAIPINGTAGGRAAGVSALVHDFSISSVDGTKTTVKIDCTSIYNTARTGYTAGTFTLASVTLQGSAYGDITPIGTAHKFTYTHLYKAGTAATYYNAGSNVTYYQGNGSSVTGRGDSVSVTPIGTAHKLRYTKLYKTQSATAEAQWAYVSDSSGSTTWYSAGSATTYYKGNGSSVTGRGSTITVTKQGSSVSVTPIGSTQWAYVGDSNGSTVYYDKGTTVTGLRRAGETDNTTYYTKS